MLLLLLNYIFNFTKVFVCPRSQGCYVFNFLVVPVGIKFLRSQNESVGFGWVLLNSRVYINL